MNKENKHKKGYYMGLGIAIGMPVGIPIGLILGNIAYGPLIGSIIGVIIGYFLEKKHLDDLLDLTSEEKQKQWFLGLTLLGVGIFAFITLAISYLL